MRTASTAAQAFLVTNRRATRSMLAITRRPSATTLGQRGEPVVEQHQLADTDFAAGVPAPMAMPRSASFRARVSFTPSPVMATTSPWPCSACSSARLASGVTRPKTALSSAASASSAGSVGQLAGVDVVLGVGDVAAQGDGRHGDRVVARDHLRPHVLLEEVLDGLGGVGPDVVAEQHQCGGAQVGGQGAGRRHACPPRPGAARAGLRRPAAAPAAAPGGRPGAGSPARRRTRPRGRRRRRRSTCGSSRTGCGRPSTNPARWGTPAGSPSWWRWGTRRPRRWRPAPLRGRRRCRPPRAARPSRG